MGWNSGSEHGQGFHVPRGDAHEGFSDRVHDLTAAAWPIALLDDEADSGNRPGEPVRAVDRDGVVQRFCVGLFRQHFLHFFGHRSRRDVVSTSSGA